MLKAVGKIAEEFKVPAELSMDEHMCCGVGVCLTCVIPVKTGDGWEYQRTCTEGPVFDSQTGCVGGGQMKFQFMRGKHRTFNIQHSTSNQAEMLNSFDVDVRC
jgi:hypothetical protein